VLKVLYRADPARGSGTLDIEAPVSWEFKACCDAILNPDPFVGAGD